jgi:hypothetical protein
VRKGTFTRSISCLAMCRQRRSHFFRFMWTKSIPHLQPKLDPGYPILQSHLYIPTVKALGERVKSEGPRALGEKTAIFFMISQPANTPIYLVIRNYSRSWHDKAALAKITICKSYAQKEKAATVNQGNNQHGNSQLHSFSLVMLITNH